MTGARMVLALDSASPKIPRVLPTGTIDPASLTAVGQTVTWTLDGAPQSATLS